MEDKILITSIELGYSPMSAYFFRNIIKSNQFRSNVSNNHIYIVAQRNEITFNNFKYDNENITFDITQADNKITVSCSLPLFQENLNTDKSKNLGFKLFDRRKRNVKNKDIPYLITQAFSIIEIDPVTNMQNELIWFSPEKLMQNHWKGLIKAKFTSDYTDLLKYNVHYVGKSTEQNICNRLSNHSTFQEILSSQDALTYGNIPSDEIVILLFKVENNQTITEWGKESSDSDLSDYLSNYQLPTQKVISLDAEKILIANLQPNYNKLLYKNYPNQNDLVNIDFHNTILYGFKDPITLCYSEGELKGNENLLERDFLSVKTKQC